MESWLMPVFAQMGHTEVATRAINPSTIMIIPIVALLIPIVIVPTALGIRFARQSRELEHTERMRALELGRSLPGDPQGMTPSALAVKIGAYVPIASMGIAWLATRDGNTSLAPGIWTSCALVSAIAIVGGTILAFRAMGLPAQSYPSAHAEKPAFDPDAYDHVGTRG